MKTPRSLNQSRRLTRYYKWHAPIYDATRWSFLFGRRQLVRALPELPARPRILEVGCGTGRNLKQLSRHYPKAGITGIDVARPMLHRASAKFRDKTRIQLLQGSYGTDEVNPPFDLILLSYSITMMGSEAAPIIINQIKRDLKPSGLIAVVDFHRTPAGWFRRWMRRNHVVMNGRLLPRLKQHYKPKQSTVHHAYLGLWSYFLFVGVRDETS